MDAKRRQQGALNIDGCRVAAEKSTGWGSGGSKLYEGGLSRDGGEARLTDSGRWPANLILSYNEDEFELRAGVTAEQKKELLKFLYENT